MTKKYINHNYKQEEQTNKSSESKYTFFNQPRALYTKINWMLLILLTMLIDTALARNEEKPYDIFLLGLNLITMIVFIIYLYYFNTCRNICSSLIYKCISLTKFLENCNLEKKREQEDIEVGKTMLMSSESENESSRSRGWESDSKSEIDRDINLNYMKK